MQQNRGTALTICDFSCAHSSQDLGGNEFASKTGLALLLESFFLKKYDFCHCLLTTMSLCVKACVTAFLLRKTKGERLLIVQIFIFREITINSYWSFQALRRCKSTTKESSKGPIWTSLKTYTLKNKVDAVEEFIWLNGSMQKQSH